MMPFRLFEQLLLLKVKSVLQIVTFSTRPGK